MTTFFQNPVERTRFLKFTVVGTIGASVDFGVFNLLSTLLHVNAVLSSMISFCMAVTSNFLWNRFWTYPDSRSKRITHQVSQFILVSLFGLSIRTPLFAFLEPLLDHEFQNNLPVQGIDPNFLGHNLALALSVGVVMFGNFFINRFWTYGDVDDIEE